jgi:hypothetical protein
LLGGSVDVDVVVPDSDVRHHLQAGRARGEHGGVDPVGEQTHDRVHFGRHADELVVREAALAIGLDELVAGFDQRIHPAGEPARDQNARQPGVSARGS